MKVVFDFDVSSKHKDEKPVYKNFTYVVENLEIEPREGMQFRLPYIGEHDVRKLTIEVAARDWVTYWLRLKAKELHDKASLEIFCTELQDAGWIESKVTH